MVEDEAKSICIDTDNLQFKTMNSTEDSLLADLTEYISKLSFPLQKSFPCAGDLIKQTFSGYDAHFLDIFSDKDLIGKACFFTDTML